MVKVAFTFIYQGIQKLELYSQGTVKILDVKGLLKFEM